MDDFHAREKQWQKLDFVSVCVCVCLQAHSEQICHVLKSQVSLVVFPFSVWRWERGEEDEGEEGGWTFFGEANPRRINSAAWSR